jgi:hypothetical protein
MSENFFEGMSFGETLEKSIEQAIEHTQGKRLLKNKIRASIPDVKNFD